MMDDLAAGRVARGAAAHGRRGAPAALPVVRGRAAPRSRSRSPWTAGRAARAGRPGRGCAGSWPDAARRSEDPSDACPLVPGCGSRRRCAGIWTSSRWPVPRPGSTGSPPSSAGVPGVGAVPSPSPPSTLSRRSTTTASATSACPSRVPRTRTGRIAAGWTHRLTSESALGAAAALVRRGRSGHRARARHGGRLRAARAAARRRRPSSSRCRASCRRTSGGTSPAAHPLSSRGCRRAPSSSRAAASSTATSGCVARPPVRRASCAADGGSSAAPPGTGRRSPRANPEAAYFHCDEIMRPAFYDTRWADVDAPGADRLLNLGSDARQGRRVPARGARPAAPPTRARGRRGCASPASTRAPRSRRVSTGAGRATSGIEDSVEWLGRLDAARIAGELRGGRRVRVPVARGQQPQRRRRGDARGRAHRRRRRRRHPVTRAATARRACSCPRGDAAALAAAIARLLDDRAAATALGAAARTTAERRNDPELVADDALTIYAEVRRRWAAR